MIKVNLETLKENATQVDDYAWDVKRIFESKSGMTVGMPTEWVEVSMPGQHNGSSIRISSEDVRSDLKRTQLAKLILLALMSGGLTL